MQSEATRQKLREHVRCVAGTRRLRTEIPQFGAFALPGARPPWRNVGKFRTRGESPGLSRPSARRRLRGKREEEEMSPPLTFPFPPLILGGRKKIRGATFHLPHNFIKCTRACIPFCFSKNNIRLTTVLFYELISGLCLAAEREKVARRCSVGGRKRGGGEKCFGRIYTLPPSRFPQNLKGQIQSEGLSSEQNMSFKHASASEKTPSKELWDFLSSAHATGRSRRRPPRHLYGSEKAAQCCGSTQRAAHVRESLSVVCTNRRTKEKGDPPSPSEGESALEMSVEGAGDPKEEAAKMRNKKGEWGGEEAASEVAS